MGTPSITGLKLNFSSTMLRSGKPDKPTDIFSRRDLFQVTKTHKELINITYEIIIFFILFTDVSILMTL